MASTTKPSPLLTLPRELRDLIMLEALTIRSPPPTRTRREIPPSGSDGQFYLWSERSNWKPLNLLAVNQQLRAEAQELTIQLQKARKIRFVMDILASGYIYTPKWTLQNLALQPQSTLDLHCNLQIRSTEAFRSNHYGGGNTATTTEEPGHAFKTLLNFLSRFLFLGPTFLYHDDNHGNENHENNTTTPFSTKGPFFIHTLSIAVTFQDHYTPATHPDTVREIFRMMKALSKLDTAGKWIGSIRVEATWREPQGGQDCRWEREWDVKKKEEERKGGEEEEEDREAADDLDDEVLRFREEDWAWMGLHFGEAWRKRYFPRRSVSV